MGASNGERPPGPDGLPLLGSSVSFVRDQLGFVERCADAYGDVVRATVGPWEFYAVNHPDHVERVLVTEEGSFERGALARNSLENFEQDALLVTDGERWRAMREALQPAFYMDNVVAYADEMGAVAAEMVDGWDDGERLEAHEEARSYALSVLSRTLFGADVRERRETIADAAEAFRLRFDASSPSVLLPDWAPTPRIRRYRSASDALDRVVEAMIDERRADPEAYDDLLSELVRRSEDVPVLDDDALRDNAKGLLVAGHDTSAVALGCTLGLLALNPDVQSRVREEVEDVVDGTPGGGDVRSLSYTDAVVREGLRLYPPAPGLLRETTEPVAFEGYTIPEGANVAVSPWVTHRDERWYDDPEQFRPERWLDDAAADGGEPNPVEGADGATDRPEYAYFPFGGGPRHCIGMRFAMTELTLAVATVCQRVELSTAMTAMPPMSGGVTLTPDGPIDVTVGR